MWRLPQLDSVPDITPRVGIAVNFFVGIAQFGERGECGCVETRGCLAIVLLRRASSELPAFIRTVTVSHPGCHLTQAPQRSHSLGLPIFPERHDLGCLLVV